jgi:hypothetical protein
MVSNVLMQETRRCANPLRSAEERDDGALSDGGDDMTPEQFGMGIFWSFFW